MNFWQYLEEMIQSIIVWSLQKIQQNKSTSQRVKNKQMEMISDWNESWLFVNGSTWRTRGMLRDRGGKCESKTQRQTGVRRKQVYGGWKQDGNHINHCCQMKTLHEENTVGFYKVHKELFACRQLIFHFLLK